jgi:hypothetical protein
MEVESLVFVQSQRNRGRLTATSEWKCHFPGLKDNKPDARRENLPNNSSVSNTFQAPMILFRNRNTSRVNAVAWSCMRVYLPRSHPAKLEFVFGGQSIFNRILSGGRYWVQSRQVHVHVHGSQRANHGVQGGVKVLLDAGRLSPLSLPGSKCKRQTCGTTFVSTQSGDWDVLNGQHLILGLIESTAGQEMRRRLNATSRY